MTEIITQRKPTILTAVVCLLGVGLVGFFSGKEFLSMRGEETLFPAAGLTEKKMLSSYFAALKGTAGDTEVFVFRGREDGGRLFILGGTHPNEPAGFLTAVVLAENISVGRGTVVIVPRANASGFTHDDPQEGTPQRYPIQTAGGPRWFRLGSRLTNSVHQWPDPAIYVNPAGQKLAGAESRNLNRCYPGRPGGTLTEKVAFGVMELIRGERIDLGIDVHESAPEYPVINAIVFHESAAELAATASMAMGAEGFDIRLEASPPNLRGLSHREWGDFAGTKAVLIETANASHGRLKGKSSASLVVDGKDRFYVRAAKLGRLFVPYPEEGIPLKLRVARHLATIRALLSSLQELEPDKEIAITGFPDPAEVLKKDVGYFLHSPK